jgi:predicted transcriptional regulator
MSTTTLTVRLPPGVRNRLNQLAEHTQRSEASLAGEAIADYVERELEIVEKINQGLEDVRAGRVVPHDEAMQQIRATIAKIAQERKAG